MIEKQFVHYELALKLKELGFKEECLAFFYKEEEDVLFETCSPYNANRTFNYISAPLWEQAFDWFTRKGLHSYIEGAYPWFRYYINTDNDRYEGFKHLKIEEARQACLEKLIKLIENEK